jgi:hypothetical protein
MIDVQLGVMTLLRKSDALSGGAIYFTFAQWHQARDNVHIRSRLSKQDMLQIDTMVGLLGDITLDKSQLDTRIYIHVHEDETDVMYALEKAYRGEDE